MMKLTGFDTWTGNDNLQVVLALASGAIMITGLYFMIKQMGL